MSQSLYIKHITAEGESFDLLALRYYYEERMAHHIIRANPDFCDVLLFSAGIPLKIPVVERADTPATLPPWRRKSMAGGEG